MGYWGTAGRITVSPVLYTLARLVATTTILCFRLLSFFFLPSVSLSRRLNKHGGSGRDVASSRYECPKEGITAQDHNYDT